VIDAHRVDSKLYVGSYPEDERVCRSFDVIVLCAQELQRLSFECHGITIRVPLDDDKLSSTDVSRVLKAAKAINGLRLQGKRVLVTCAAGVNRSALVAGVAMVKTGLAPDDVIVTIRRLRKPSIGMTPLGNPYFVDLLRRMR
jgi:hypothetical protein